jgi:hypothetical protein
MRVTEPVCVDLAERFRIAIGRELVVGRDRIVAEPFHAARLARAARVDAQDRRDQGVQALRRTRVVRVWPAAIAEAEIAAARIQQPVVGRPRPRGRIELDGAQRMARELHDVRNAQELAPRSRERARLRIGGVPLREDVVKRGVARPVAGRNEIGPRGISRGILEMHAVPEAVAREIRVERKTDEAALEPRVPRARKSRRDVGVQRRARAVDYIKESARVVHETAPVGRITDETDARPPRRRDVLIDGPKVPRLGQADDVLHLDGEPLLLDRRRQRVGGDLRPSGNGSRQQYNRDPHGWRKCRKRTTQFAADGPRFHVKHAPP